MMTTSAQITTRRFDMVNYLHNQEDIVEYLKVSFETGDEKQIVRALAQAARAQGLLKTATKTGLNRQNLYKTLIYHEGNPTLHTLNKLIQSFGCSLSVQKLKKAA